ncbi:hypothetical protein AB5I41_11405 [Sphingomonas sp. MMS24-JH45]
MKSLLKDHTIQKFWPDYNFYNELQRFGEVANMSEVYRPDSRNGGDLREQKANDANFDPTFNIYAASRDLMRARNADWQGKYTTPQLWNYFQSTRDNHGSYFFDWTSQIETNWKGFYQDYFRLIHDYNQIGGRTTVGTNSGFIYKVYGFAYIEELELFQEAGFTPLEISVGDGQQARRSWSPLEPVRRGAPRHAGGSGDRVAGKPARQSQDAVRHRLRPAEPRHQQAGTHRRRALHDQGRHRVRRAQAAGRGRGDGRAGEADGADPRRAPVIPLQPPFATQTTAP